MRRPALEDLGMALSTARQYGTDTPMRRGALAQQFGCSVAVVNHEAELVATESAAMVPFRCMQRPARYGPISQPTLASDGEG